MKRVFVFDKKQKTSRTLSLHYVEHVNIFLYFYIFITQSIWLCTHVLNYKTCSTVVSHLN